MPGRLKDALVGSACRLLALPFPEKRQPPPPPRRLLVVKPGSLGDVLLAGSALASLRSAYPNARVVQLVGSWARPAAAGCPNVDELLDCGPVGTPGKYSWREYLRVVAQVRRQRFDAAVVLDRSPLMAMLPWLAGIKVRAGLDSGGRGFALRMRASPLPRRNESELYLDVVRRMGVDPVRPRRWFRPSERDRSRVRSELAAAGSPERFLVTAPGGGVNPGSSRLQKRWSAQGFIRTVAEVRRRAGVLPVLVGDEGDSDAVAQVRQGLGDPVLDLSRRLSFGEVAALLELAGGFLANDSATAHLGAAVGAAGVVMYTVTDPDVYGPSGEQVVKLVASAQTDAGAAAVQALLTAIAPRAAD